MSISNAIAILYDLRLPPEGEHNDSNTDRIPVVMIIHKPLPKKSSVFYMINAYGQDTVNLSVMI